MWRDSDGLAVGCALLSFGTEAKRPLRIRCAYLNATGVPHASSEHNDVLALPEHRDAVLDDLVRAICDADVDELVLAGVRESTAVALQERWPVQSQEGYFSEAPYVALEDLRASHTPYLETLTSGARSRVRRSIRLYRDRFGPERIELARPGREALDWFAEMVTLHETRWRAKGHSGSFQRPAVRHFHEGLLARGGAGPSTGLKAEIMRLSFGDEAIGFLYTLTSGGSVCFFQSGLKYHADNRLKPGLVTHVLAAEYFLDHGADEYDFLGGEPEPVRYKRSLSTDVRLLGWLHLPAPSRKMQAFYAIRRLLRALRSGGSGAAVKALQGEDRTLYHGNRGPPPLGGQDRPGPSARAHSRLAS